MSPFVQMYLYSLIPASLAIIGCVALLWKAGVSHITGNYDVERSKSVIMTAGVIIGIVACCLLLGGIGAGAAALDVLKPGCP